MKNVMPRHLRTAVLVALSYVAMALTWIVLSDQTLSRRLTTIQGLNTAQTIKGIGFVLVTGTLLFGIIALLMQRLIASRDALAAGKQQLQAVLDSQIDLVCRYTPDTTVIFANDAYRAFFGPGLHHVLNKPFLPRVAPADRTRVQERIAETLATREPNVSVVKSISPDGRTAHIEWVTQVVSPPGEEPPIIQAVGRDVTERVSTRQQLLELNEGLEARVRKRTEELRQANDELRQLAEAKDHFVSNVSHELRAPLTSMKLQAAMLAKRHPATGERVTRIQRDITRMEQTINDLRDLARLEQRTAPPEPQPIDLIDLITTYTRDRLPVAQMRGIKLNIAPPLDPLPKAKGVPSLIEQTAGILLNNAIVYTPRGGSVTVRFAAKQLDGTTYAGFSIVDTGIGIPPEEQDAIFERFYRGQQARKTHDTGTGLGLPIAKAIVTTHNGLIDVESTPGEGSCFNVWLPA